MAPPTLPQSDQTMLDGGNEMTKREGTKEMNDQQSSREVQLGMLGP